MASGLPPLLLRPHYAEKPWGGRRMASDLARPDFPPGRIGESWEVFDFTDEHGPGAASRIDGGPHDGASLRDVLGVRVPLVLKILDAREDLSVQVHPDDRAAKEEAWVALADGASVALAPAGATFTGASGGVPASGRWLEHLRRIPLYAGSRSGARPPSLVHVPPGTVHVILAGSLLCEVQNAADTTWRLDDHGRTDPDGRPRALHLSEAAALLARPAPEAVAPEDGGRRLVGARFVIHLLPPGTVESPDADVLYFTAPGTVAGGSQEPVAVPAARTVWLPEPVDHVSSTGWIVAASPR